MPTRIAEPRDDEVTDPAVPVIVDAMRNGWWADSALARALSRRPESRETTVALVETLYTKSGIDPVLLELMRIAVAKARDNRYSVIRVRPFAEQVECERALPAPVADHDAATAGRVRRDHHPNDADDDPPKVTTAAWSVQCAAEYQSCTQHAANPAPTDDEREHDGRD